MLNGELADLRALQRRHSCGLRLIPVPDGSRL